MTKHLEVDIDIVFSYASYKSPEISLGILVTVQMCILETKNT